MDDAKLKKAKETFATVCRALDNNGWNYDADEAELRITSGFKGETFSLRIIIVVDAKRQVLSFLYPLPFSISEDKRLDVASALCIANNFLVHGHFDFKVTEDQVFFRMPNSFMESTLGEEAVIYMLIAGCRTMDEYADKLMMLNKGYIDLTKFIEMENE